DPGPFREIQQLRRDQQLDRASDELLPREPGELLDVAVRVYDPAVALRHDETLRRRLQQRPRLDQIRQSRLRPIAGTNPLQPETHPEEAFQPGVPEASVFDEPDLRGGPPIEVQGVGARSSIP